MREMSVRTVETVVTSEVLEFDPEALQVRVVCGACYEGVTFHYSWRTSLLPSCPRCHARWQTDPDGHDPFRELMIALEKLSKDEANPPYRFRLEIPAPARPQDR
jgi:hypothetical protein